MAERGTPARTDPGALAPVISLFSGLALVLLPWVAMLAGFLSAPIRSLKRISVPLLVAASLVLLASLITGQIDRFFIPLLALGALAVGVGKAFGLSASARSMRLLERGALAALAIMAAESAWDLLGQTWMLPALLPFVGQDPAVPGRAAGWLSHPNQWAAAALPVTTLLAVRTAREDRVVEFLVAVALGLGIVLGSGSRSALFGLVLAVVLVFVGWLRRAPSKRVSVMAWLGGVATVALIVLLALNVGWRQRILGSIGTGAPPAPSKNLMVSSEDLLDPVWWSPNVEVQVTGGGSGPAEHRLTRHHGQWTDRLQQRVWLAPHSAYTLSLELRPVGSSLEELMPAVVGWSGANDLVSELVVVLGANGVARQNASGAVRLGSVELDASGAWAGVAITFENVSDATQPLELGVAPSTLGPILDTNVWLEVRRIQLEQGLQATSYSPTLAPDRRRLQAASAVDTRMRTYEFVLERFRERPLFGWGADAFAEQKPDSLETAASLPDHEHSLPLALMFRFGLLGLIALALGAIGTGGRNPDAWAIVVAVLAANIFDLTVFHSSIYLVTPLAAGLVRGRSALLRGAVHA